MVTNTEEKGPVLPATHPTWRDLVWLGIGVALVALLLVGTDAARSKTVSETSSLMNSIAASVTDVVLPIAWADTGQRMIAAGVIDAEKFESLYAARGGMSEDIKKLLYERDNGTIVMRQENANELLNLLWAFGLSNKNDILEHGPMVDPRYGGDASRFASTGGWTISKGNVMNHYSAHPFITLTEIQQQRVERVSKNIYRPCCNNPTFFPDCNHGMAMLGLLELLAAEGANEEEMYAIALRVNEFWFPDTYRVIAQYVSDRGGSWSEIDPKEILGETYSSASGYQNIRSQVVLPAQQSGSGCGV